MTTHSFPVTTWKPIPESLGEAREVASDILRALTDLALLHAYGEASGSEVDELTGRVLRRLSDVRDALA
jgi:hypothetical protein